MPDTRPAEHLFHGEVPVAHALQCPSCAERGSGCKSARRRSHCAAVRAQEMLFGQQCQLGEGIAACGIRDLYVAQAKATALGNEVILQQERAQVEPARVGRWRRILQSCSYLYGPAVSARMCQGAELVAFGLCSAAAGVDPDIHVSRPDGDPLGVGRCLQRGDLDPEVTVDACGVVSRDTEFRLSRDRPPQIDAPLHVNTVECVSQRAGAWRPNLLSDAQTADGGRAQERCSNHQRVRGLPPASFTHGQQRTHNQPRDAQNQHEPRWRADMGGADCADDDPQDQTDRHGSESYREHQPPPGDGGCAAGSTRLSICGRKS